MSDADAQPEPIRYKWDPETCTGYQLRFDAEGAAHGGQFPIHVEDWNCRTVTYEWPCHDLDEALDVLNRLFSLDIEEERARLKAWLPAEYQASL